MSFRGRPSFNPDSERTPSKWKKSREKRVFKKALPKVARDQEEVDRLNKQCADLSSFSNLEHFASFPISTYTLQGLSFCGYEKPTDIQKQTVGLALRGCDVLGAAKTGSGKTLAFIIPVLELLYRNRWCKEDGMGALIITPVRELAYQIFEILKLVGKYHYFSAALIIGGQNLDYEKERMDVCNIIICTPGRLLQHMEENPLCSADNLKILVLDEADRILDMGFANTMNEIFTHLSTDRQTLLFSATQTKSVKDLARASLNDPVYVSVHEHSVHSTPDNLQQSYVVCELQDKLDFLWSFLCYHREKKVLVFVTCCKQVIYIVKAFKELKIRMRVIGLHGGQHQEKRLAAYENFCKNEDGILVATDVASRGLDFPAVDWVIQLDCPEDAKTYIHRAGRTARFDAGGESLLVLMPSEEAAMIEHLSEKKIPITKIKIAPDKQFSLKNKLNTLVAANPDLKDCAQRAFVTYMKAIFLMKDKEVFDVTKLDSQAYSGALGLVMQPRLRFVQKKTKQMEEAKARKAAKAAKQQGLVKKDRASLSDSDQSESEENSKPANPMFEYDTDKSSDDDYDLLVVKRVLQPDDIEAELGDGQKLEYPAPKAKTKIVTKVAKAKKLINKKIKPNTKIAFNEAGEVVVDVPKQQQSEAARNAELSGEGVPCGINFQVSADIMKEEFRVDKSLFHKRVRDQHREERWQEREMMRAQYADRQNAEQQLPRLGGVDSDNESVDLSWLPDPDKLYGPEGAANDNDDEESDDGTTGDDESSEDKEVVLVKKRKPVSSKRKFAPVTKKPRTTRSSDEDDSDEERQPLDTKCSLLEDEQLALRLLQ